MEKEKAISGEYHYEYIKERELAFMKLVKRLMPEIERGEYSVLIGDDTSARIFTLALKQVMEKMSGVEIPTRFYPGKEFFHHSDSISVDRNDFLNFIRHSPFMVKVLNGIRNIAVGKEQRALLLTEATFSGSTNVTTMWVLESECNVVADLAVVDFPNNPVEFAEALGFLLRRIKHESEDISKEEDVKNKFNVPDQFGRNKKAGGKYFEIERLSDKAGIELRHDGHSHRIFYSKRTEDTDAPSWGDAGASGVVKQKHLRDEHSDSRDDFLETWSRHRFLYEYEKRYGDKELLLLDAMRKIKKIEDTYRWGPDYEDAKRGVLYDVGMSDDEYGQWYYSWYSKKKLFGLSTEKTRWGREDAKLLAERTLRALVK